MGSWHAQHSLEVLYSSTSKNLRPWKQNEPHFHDAVAENAYLIQTLRSSSQLQHHEQEDVQHLQCSRSWRRRLTVGIAGQPGP